MARMLGLLSRRRSRAAGFLLCLAAALLSAPVDAEEIPAEFRGTWSPRCTDPAAPRLVLAAGGVEVTAAGRSDRFGGLDISRTWMGGVRASGPGIWFIVSRRPGQPIVFVAAAAQGAKGTIVLEESDPDYARQLKSLFGVPLRRCPPGAGAIQPGSTAAPGDQPAYVGLWARQLASCADADSRIRFTRRGTEEVESTCDFDRIDGGDGRWSVRQTCHVEATKTRSRMEISVEGDRMTLLFPGKKGGPTRLVRCR